MDDEEEKQEDKKIGAESESKAKTEESIESADQALDQPDASENIEVKKEEEPEEHIVVEKIGNKTVERRGGDVTITEVMQEEPAPPRAGRASESVAFPAPFTQKGLWQQYLQKTNERKRKKLDKIVEYLNKNQKISNDQVEKLLRVSDATATRYLDQLEKENKIKQVGTTGRHTHYVLS